MILNGSFEDYSYCPSSGSSGSDFVVLNNISSYNSADFFHECTLVWEFYPQTNFINPAEPYHGQGYAGVISGGNPPLMDTTFLYREIITGELSDSLITGKLYCFTAQVLAASKAQYFTDGLDVLFVTDTLSFYSFSSPTHYNFTPQVRNTRVFTDTAQWQLMSGAFVAQDAYRFFHLGNLRTTTSQMQIFTHPYPYIYYSHFYHLIDDLQLTEISRPEFLYTHTCEGEALAASVSGADSVRWYREGQLFSQQPNILLTDIQSGESLITEYFLCNYTFTDTLTVPPCTVPEPEFPNIITPNGDGVNDAFFVKNLLAGSSLIIYNRWGNEVFRTAHYNNNWQGQTETLGIETKVSDGTYFYVLITPEGKQYKGTVTVVK